MPLSAVTRCCASSSAQPNNLTNIGCPETGLPMGATTKQWPCPNAKARPLPDVSIAVFTGRPSGDHYSGVFYLACWPSSLPVVLD